MAAASAHHRINHRGIRTLELCNRFLKRPSLLKNSPACESEPFKRLWPTHFARKSSSNLSIETYFGLDVATDAHFSTGWPIMGTTLPVFPRGSVRGWFRIMRLFLGYRNQFALGDKNRWTRNVAPLIRHHGHYVVSREAEDDWFYLFRIPGS